MAIQKRYFSGMGYREVQRSNAKRRERLPQPDRTWLKANGYKNVGWEHVIKLYQKINDLLSASDADEPSLEALFLKADRIGGKYQTPEEKAAVNQQLADAASEVAELVDQQFPEPEFEAIDYRPRSRSGSNKKKNK